MSVSFIKTPGLVSLSGNQVIFHIAGENGFSSFNTKAVNKLSVTGEQVYTYDGTTQKVPDAIDYTPYGETFEKPEGSYYVTAFQFFYFTWNSRTVLLYTVPATATYLNANYNYPAGDGSTAYKKTLAAHLAQNSLLAYDFTISYDGENDVILFTAKRCGEAYNLTLFSTNPLSLTTDPEGSTKAARKNYSIGLRPEQDEEPLVELELPGREYLATDGELPGGYGSDATKIVSVDISGILQEEQTGHFTFPTTKNYGAFHDIIKQFRLYAFEKYGTIPTEREGAYSDYFYYLQGKLSDFTAGYLNDMEKTFYDNLCETGFFLSNSPTQKITDIYAPERLYFLFTKEGTFKLAVKQYYADNTTTVDYKEAFYATRFQVRELFVSYDKVRTGTAKLTKYEVYFTDSSGATVSETRTFTLDYQYQPYARYFYFLNRFGVYEMVRTTGRVSKTREISKAFATMALKDFFSYLDKKEKQVSADATTSYEINSGYFPDELTSDWFQEFLISKDVYWLKKGQAYPVNINESKQTVKSDDDYLPNTTFTLTHSLHDDFSEEFSANTPIIIGDFNLDFNTDYFTGSESDAMESVFDDVFDTWEEGLPASWSEGGKGTISNDEGRAKISSPTGKTKALSYTTSFMSGVVYKLSVTVDYISPGSYLLVLASNYTSDLITSSGEYSFTFSFESIAALCHALSLQFAAYSGVSGVYCIISEVKLEYAPTELEENSLEEDFTIWDADSDMAVPNGWSACGSWGVNNYTRNEQNKLRVTLSATATGMYNLSHNFKFTKGETYKVTLKVSELSNLALRMYTGNTQVAYWSESGELSAEFTPSYDFYSFDVRFELLSGERTALVEYFLLEKS